MRWLRGVLVLLSFSGLIFMPTEAFAITLAPPGKAGADQYFETIPNSAGNAAPPSTGATSASSSALSHLGNGRAGSARLARLGKDGRSAAGLAAATAPSAGASAAGRHGDQGAATGAQGDSSFTGLTDALGGADSGGLGILLPLLLGTTLVLALGLIISRALRASGPPELEA